MNCRPGDLAIIVLSTNGRNLGKMVRIIEDWAHRETFEGRKWAPAIGPQWLVESLGSPLNYGGKNIYQRGGVLDSRLRPIRPGDTADTEQSHKEAETV